MGHSLPAIRPARPEDAKFIARNILSSQRGPLPRGWFDIALGWGEMQCLDFVERIAVAPTPSWWHVSHWRSANGGCWRVAISFALSEP